MKTVKVNTKLIGGPMDGLSCEGNGVFGETLFVREAGKETHAYKVANVDYNQQNELEAEARWVPTS